MPINPNIALGGQPVQQPNVLGQMGQMMALKAAAQEIEGGEGVRGLLKEGAPEDPTALLQYGKQGRATYESLLRGRKEQLESTVKKIGITSSAFKVIEDNPTLETAQRVFGDLVNLGAMDKRAAADAFAKVTANPTPENIRSLARQGIEYGITAAQRLTAETSRYATNVAAGTAANRLSFDERGRAYDRANPTLTPIQGSYQIPDQNAPGGFRQVEGFGGFNTRTGTVTPAQIRAAAAAPTLANSLAAAQPAPVANNNVNALNPNFITSAAPASPVVPSAAATAPSASAAVPSAALPTTAAQAGVFRPKPSPQAEKQAQDEIERKRGKVEVANIIGGLASKYTNLASTGGMTSTNKGVLENIGSYLANTALGQEAGKMTATQEQSLRNEIRAQSPVLLQGIKKATGMTAKEMDSNADVKRWMEAMGSTTFDVQATLGILKSLNAQFGSGNEIPAAPANTGNIASDPAIQSLINKYSK
jgi:hypothetical protein